MGDIIILLIFLSVCYFIGKSREQKHYKSIIERETALKNKPFVTFEKKILTDKKIESADLVSSSVVIGCDYFREFLANLRNIFGGNVSTYESIMDRCRREAILRIRQEALNKKADIVVNVKIETIMLDPITASQKPNPKCCITAYGTAIKYGE